MSERPIRLKIRIVVEEDDGALVASCPELPGLMVEAADFDSLKPHVIDAITGYLESLIKHNEPIPLGLRECEEETSIFKFAMKRIEKRLLTARHTKQYTEEIPLPFWNNNHAVA